MGPCKNPNCKSYGKVHPNCRCYGNLAKGGEVNFCDQGMSHDKDCHYFAEGGDSVPESLRANDDSDESSQPNHGVNININAQPQQPQTQTQPQAQSQPGMQPANVSATPPPALQAAPQPAPQSQPVPMPSNQGLDQPPSQQDDDSQPQANPDVMARVHAPDNYGHPSLPMPGQNKQQYTKSVYDDLNDQAAKVSQDYANGHIAPKTYHELFAKNSDGTDRGTLSKIGMMFSLILGGAASGLTHGPNVALGMMDKIIDNDLQAQKSSKSDQINFLNTAANFYRTKSDVALQGKQGELVGAQTRLADTNNKLLKVNLAKTNAMLASVQHIYGLVDNMPPGAQKNQAAQVADGIHTAVNQEILKNNAQTSAAVGNNSEDSYNKTTQQLRGLGMLGQEGATENAKYREEHQIPGVGTSKVPISSDDRKRVLQINNFQNLIQEAKDFQKKSELGALTPAQKARADQLKADLVSSYNDVKGLARFTSNEENLYDKIVPNLGSNVGALTGSQKALLDRLDSSVQQKKNLEYKQLGITPFSDNQPAQQNDSQGMVRVIDPNGKIGNIPRSNLNKAIQMGYQAK